VIKIKGIKKYIQDKIAQKYPSYCLVLSNKMKKRTIIIQEKIIKLDKKVVYDNIHDKPEIDKIISEVYNRIQVR